MGDKKLEKLTTNDLQVFFNTIKAQGNIKTDGPLSDKTVKNIYQMLHCCLGQAVENDLIRKNFCDGVELPSQDVKEEARVLNKEEREKIFYALDNCNDLIVRKNEQLHLEKSSTRYATDTLGYRYVIYTALFTGARIGEVMALQWKDVDFDNNVVYVNVTKNRKPLIVPLNQTMVNILAEYLKYRQHTKNDDFLFCNVFGQQLVKSTCYHMLYEYNKRRGVQTTGIHRYRHTFAKQWILNGGNVVSLSKLLGHSSLDITQNYINLLVSEVAKQVDEFNVLDKFYGKKRISMIKE